MNELVIRTNKILFVLTY